MAPGKKKTGNDSKPSTSKSTADSQENIRPKRQATKKVKPGAMLEEEDSSGDDFEPSPPKSVKKSPKKPSKKDMKKSPSKPSKKDPKKSQKKEKKVLAPIMDTNANFEDTTITKDKNIILALNSFQSGGKCRTSFGLEHCARSVIVNQLNDFQVFKSVTPFDRRVTAICWHPKRPNFCAVGSKGGEIILWKYDKDEFEGIQEGIGPGGSIQKILFDGNNHSRVYTCSIDGTFEVKDLCRTGPTEKETFLNTKNWDKWYTSFDIAPDSMTIITG